MRVSALTISVKNQLTLSSDAVHLLIERIDIKKKTVTSIESTLATVLGEIGCGGLQHILPTIIFRYILERETPAGQNADESR